MPVQRGAVTFARFLALPPQKTPTELKRWLGRGLKARAFEPIDRKSDEDRAAGFVELEDNGGVEFPVGALFHGERAIFAWRIDTLRIPSAVLKAELEKWSSTFEKEKGRPPARSEKSETRASLRQMLRNRAVPVTKVHDLTWNLENGQLQVWAASRKVVEEIQAALEGAFEMPLIDRVPVAMAKQAGIDEDSLTPTAALVGVALDGSDGTKKKEVARGAA